jgi:arginine deiminase
MSPVPPAVPPVLAVASEVGRLREVVVHRPGSELTRLTPGNIGDLLFDDVMWVERAREEHDAFVAQLIDQGVVVHHFHDLLVEALQMPGARSFLVEELATADRFGLALAGLLARYISEGPADQVAEVLVGGLTRADVAEWDGGSSLLLRTREPDDFVVTPLPNHLYQRDAAAWIYERISVNPLARPARHREWINTRQVHLFHPLFSGDHQLLWGGAGGRDARHATMEGGDVHVLGRGAVMVGMGERTTPQGVEALALRLFETGTAARVVVVEIPRTRAFVHLDTALTQVDRDAFSVYPYLPDRLRTWELRPGRAGRLEVTEHRHLHRVLADVLEVPQVRMLQVPMDRMAAEREQWDDGNNFLAVRPGVVLGYECNTTTNRYLTDHGIEILPVTGSELGRGRGGPRCMTCPISREP